MMKIQDILLLSSVLPLLFLPINNVAAGKDDPLHDWQTNRLFNPSDSVEKIENKGQVFVYSSLTDVEVERALDQQFDRMESMMFINTEVTDEDGSVVINPYTGEPETEDDC